MKYVKYLSIAVTIILLAYQIADAGWNWNRIRGNGNLTTKEVKLEDFVEVSFGTQGTATVQSGSENKVIIHGEDNLLEYLKVEVRGGTLIIRAEDGYSLDPRKPLKFDITATQPIEQLSTLSSGDLFASKLSGDWITLSTLSSGNISVDNVDAKNIEMSINSSGDIKVGELKGETLDVRINSSGDISIEGGTIEEQDVKINSSGDFRALRLESKEAYVNINSSGDCRINVSDFLRVRGNSSGDVRLVGNPKIDSSMNSSGRLRRASI